MLYTYAPPHPAVGVSGDEEVSRKTRAEVQDGEAPPSQCPPYSLPRFKPPALHCFLRGFSLLPPRSPEASQFSVSLQQSEEDRNARKPRPPFPVPASPWDPESRRHCSPHLLPQSWGARDSARAAFPSRLKLRKLRLLRSHFYAQAY